MGPVVFCIFFWDLPSPHFSCLWVSRFSSIFRLWSRQAVSFVCFCVSAATLSFVTQSTSVNSGLSCLSEFPSWSVYLRLKLSLFEGLPVSVFQFRTFPLWNFNIVLLYQRSVRGKHWELFSVFMWRNHIPKLNITFPSEGLVLSDKRPNRNLSFHNVLAQQGSSYCSRGRLNFPAFPLRDMKIVTREGYRVGQKMSYHFSFC